MNKDSRIFVAGNRGMVGGAIVRKLKALGYENLALRSKGALDLRDSQHVERFFSEERPEYVYLAAARVGGILANDSFPAEFLRDNLQIQNNVIDAAHRFGCRKLLFLGSSCIYPKLALQPLKEEYLLTGALEPTNEWYAVAKIAGIKLCQAYQQQYGFSCISVMPTNLYGPNDNFSLTGSHVVPALMRKLHEAVLSNSGYVEVWGTGKPRREFMHVDDLADALLFLMENYDAPEPINVGTGKDITLSGLVELLANIIGFKGQARFDASKPDGTPRKLLDISRLRQLGWEPKIGLTEGLHMTYDWFRQNVDAIRF